MTPFLILATAVGVVATLAAAIPLTRRASRQRTAALREMAGRLGWGLRDDIAMDAIPDLDRFELFRPGRSKRLSNAMTSPAGDPRAVIFDYTYTTAAGNSRKTHRQTVFYAARDNLMLPSFSLRPEHFMHRVRGMFGYQDIDLEGHPEFSRMFLLRGADEAEVRVTFDGRVAEFFELRAGSCAAGLGRELLFWRTGRYARPDEIEELIRAGNELAERLAAPRG